MEQQQIDAMNSDKTSKAGKGRKSSDGSAEVIKFDSIKKGCSEMMKAFKRYEDAREQFNTCVTGVAERSNCNAATLKRLIRASAQGKFADVRNKIDQEQIVFETVGEVAGGSISGGV